MKGRLIDDEMNREQTMNDTKRWNQGGRLSFDNRSPFRATNRRHRRSRLPHHIHSPPSIVSHIHDAIRRRWLRGLSGVSGPCGSLRQGSYLTAVPSAPGWCGRWWWCVARSRWIVAGRRRTATGASRYTKQQQFIKKKKMGAELSSDGRRNRNPIRSGGRRARKERAER